MPRTSPNVLLGVLSGLLVAAIGTLTVAVWAITGIVAGSSTAVLLAVVAAISLGGFLFLVLLTMGILYRVDRINRDVERRVALFE